VLQKSFVLLQDYQNTQGRNCFDHISKTMHPFAKLFQGDIYKDDGNMLKKFQKVSVHTFREIGLHHLQPCFFFIIICAFVGQNFLSGVA